MQVQAQLDREPSALKARRSAQEVRERIRLILLELLMIALVITFLVPTFWMISSSLKASTEVFAQPITWIPSSPRWENYVKIFQVLPLTTFIVNTMIITVLAVLGTVVSSVPVAYAFSRVEWPGRNIWFSLLLATMMLPELVLLVPRFILFRTFGWLDTFLPLIIPYWTATTALYVFLIRQFFLGIPVELEEAAKMDGASRLRILCQIIVPLSTPVIVTVVVFAFIQHYNEFLNPLIYLNSMSKWPLAVGIRAYNDSFAAQWELVFAASTVMLAPMVALFIVAQRYFVQGIALTGFGGK